MKRWIGALVVACLAMGAPVVARGNAVDLAGGGSARSGGVTVTSGPNTITLANDFVSRTWSLAPFQTTRLVDLRTGDEWASTGPDFRFTVDGAEVRSDQLTVSGASELHESGGRVQLTFDLGVADRIVEMWPDTAGFRSRTVLKIPGAVSGYTLDEVAVGNTAAVAVHGFHAGADWREPDWAPQLALGDANTGDWRRTVSGNAGQPINETAQWLSARDATTDARLFMVMERNNYASSTMRYDGGTVAANVDLSRDIIYTGPFEEDIHVQNPTPGPARHTAVTNPTALEPVFTGVAINGDDEPWQHHVYLSRHRMAPWDPVVTFNTNNVDANAISTGAKDDVDFAEFQRQLAVAKDLGVEVFIFDDGWQARSGDWCPDSEDCPEPRADQYGFRFPDSTFSAVRQELDGMRLGLWMTPMHFHTSAEAFTSSPEWACTPTGDGTALVTAADPESGSQEAGIGQWNPRAVGLDPDTGDTERLIDYIEGRIRRAITLYGSTYFKFDFTVWIDCLGVDPVDMYQYRESFMAMLDNLIADFPEVVFQIDETNDYRLFPFESIARGPSWFQNGKPTSDQLLHNLWSLAPFIPGYTLGQHAISNSTEREQRGVDYLMAVSLASHITFWTDLTTLTTAEIQTARTWVDRYAAFRDRLGTMSYPLLDDPLGGQTWTGLQPWNLDTGSGLVLVYRQNHPAATRTVPLHGLTAPSYTVTDVVTGASLGTFPASQLSTTGLPVTLASPFSAAVLEVIPVA